MKNNRQIEQPPGITLGDVYFVLFRHKWKILLCSVAGIVAAIVFFLFNPPPYQSDAMLFIRYVVDSRSLSPAANNSTTTSPDEMGESIMNSEMEILSSFDLALEAATNIGPEKILAAT